MKPTVHPSHSFMSMIPNKITCVGDIFEIRFNHLLPNKNQDWVYRGHSDATYQIMPSLGRVKVDYPLLQEKEILEREESAYNEFLLSKMHTMSIHNAFVLLSIAQHHGLKTRMLDWTLSPLAALFFAVESFGNRSKDGSIHAYPLPEVAHPKEIISGTDDYFNLGKDVFMKPPAFSPRIPAQSGILQIFKNPFVEFTDISLLKFIIPSTSKTRIMQELVDSGITYSSLFPDTDGLCKTLNYQYFSEG